MKRNVVFWQELFGDVHRQGVLFYFQGTISIRQRCQCLKENIWQAWQHIWLLAFGEDITCFITVNIGIKASAKILKGDLLRAIKARLWKNCWHKMDS